MNNTKENYMTTSEIIEFFNISKSTIYRFRKEGMPYFQIGYNKCLYEREEVKKWLKERYNNASWIKEF